MSWHKVSPLPSAVPSLSPYTPLSLKRGRAATTLHTPLVYPDGVVLHCTSPIPGVLHWASPCGRPQSWHTKERKRKKTLCTAADARSASGS